MLAALLFMVGMDYNGMVFAHACCLHAKLTPLLANLNACEIQTINWLDGLRADWKLARVVRRSCGNV